MKIAIITHNPHYNIGGIETTVRNKCSFWHNKHQITEYPTFLIKEDIKKVAEPFKDVKVDYSLLGWKPYNILWGGSYTKKKMTKIFNENDIVIFDTLVPAKRWLSHPKAIIVQHEYQKFYSRWGKGFGISLGTLFSSFLFGAGSFKNPFRKASNSVFFTKYDQIKTKGNTYQIQLPALKTKEIKALKISQKRSGTIWIARIDNRIKDLKSLVYLANSNSDLEIYGDGRDKSKLLSKLNNNKQFKGFLNHDEIYNTLNKYRAMVMTSKFEGFPNTIVESLSAGVPVILFNTFESATFLEESGAVFLIKPGDKVAFDKKIKWIEKLSDKEYNILAKKAKDFAIKYLSMEIYEKKWDNVIKEVNARNKQ